MVSTKRFPANTPAQIGRHIKGGAILIQFKFGSDLISSITDERINIALARMIECGAAHQWQRVILGVGIFVPDYADGKVVTGRVRSSKHGKVAMSWRKEAPLVDYKALATIRRRIGMRGGTFINLTCDEEVPGELIEMEHDLAFLSGQRKKEILTLGHFPPDPPGPTDPLQMPVEVKDARRVIAAFRGVGPKKTNELWGALRDHNEEVCEGTDVDTEPTLAQALGWLLEWDRKWIAPKKIAGWGPGTVKSVREQMGLLPGQDFYVRVTEVVK